MEPDAKPTEATERRWPKLTAEERKQSIDELVKSLSYLQLEKPED